MVRGFYTLASGMLTMQRKLDTISNNVANVQTAGYKKKLLTSSTFDRQLLARIETENNKMIGKGAIVRYADELHTDYSQSSLSETDIPFDIALVGDGFFRLESPDETIETPLLTRNGHFMLDDEGYLALSGGGRVLGESGPIQVITGKFAVDDDGYVYVEGDDSPVDRISLAFPTDNTNLTVYAEGLYIDNNPEQAEFGDTAYSTSFMQGKIENSNVDMAEETAALMEASRTFQTYSQAIAIVDKINAKSVTEIGRV
ncbi:MAG: flagellar hook-basal body protein [Acetanaerobacterium sp.]